MKIIIYAVCALFSSLQAQTLHFDFQDDAQLTWAIYENLGACWQQADHPSIEDQSISLTDFKNAYFDSTIANAFNSQHRPFVLLHIPVNSSVEDWLRYDSDLEFINGAFCLSERVDNLQQHLLSLRDHGVKARIIVDTTQKTSNAIILQLRNHFISSPSSISDGLKSMENHSADRFVKRLKLDKKSQRK